MQAILITGNEIRMILQVMTPAQWKIVTDLTEKIAEWGLVLVAGIAWKHTLKSIRAIRPGIASDVMKIASAEIDRKMAEQWSLHESKTAERFSKIDSTLQSVLTTQTVQAASLRILDEHKQLQIKEFQGLREELKAHYPKLSHAHRSI